MRVDSPVLFICEGWYSFPLHESGPRILVLCWTRWDYLWARVCMLDPSFVGSGFVLPFSLLLFAFVFQMLVAYVGSCPVI